MNSVGNMHGRLQRLTVKEDICIVTEKNIVIVYDQGNRDVLIPFMQSRYL